VVRLETSAGAAITGASADVAIDAHFNGAAASVAPSVSEISSGYYSLEVTAPSGAGLLSLRIRYTGASPGALVVGDLAEYSIGPWTATTIAGIIGTGEGVGAVEALPDAVLPSVVQGDSYRSGPITIPLSPLARFGLSTLSGLSISAGARLAPGDDPSVALTASIDDAANRIVSIGWDVFPSDLDLAAGAESQVVFVDIQFITGADLVLTPFRAQFTVLWDRDDTEVTP
jgi:hypothetical protein